MQQKYVYHFTTLFCQLSSATTCYIQSILRQYKSWPQIYKHLGCAEL